MAGLDIIKGYAEGEDVTPTETTTTTAPGGLPISVSSKGVAVPTGKIVADPEASKEMLRNMEAFLAQRNDPWRTLNRGLERMSAWAVPSIGGEKAQALNTVMTRQNAEDEMRMQKQNELIAMKAAIAQQEAFNKRRLTGGVGSAGVGAGGAGTQIPPLVQQALDNAQSKDEYDKIFNAWAQTSGKAGMEAAGRADNYAVPATPNAIDVKNGQPVAVAPILLQQQPNRFKPLGSTFEPTVEPTVVGGGVGGEQAARDAGLPVISGDRDIAKQQKLYTASQQPGYNGPPVAKPGDSLHQSGMALDLDTKNLKPEQRKWLADNGYVQTLPTKDPNHWAKLPVVSGGTVPTTTTKESVVPSSTVKAQPDILIPMPKMTGNALQDQEALRTWKAQNDEAISVKREEDRVIAKTEGEKKTEYTASVGTSDSTFNQLDNLLKNSKGQQDVFDLKSKGAGKIAGLVLPKINPSNKESINRQIRDIALPEDKRKVFDLIDTGSSQAQADWAKNLVQGAGGRLSNADLALGKIAKGVGTDQSYEAHMASLAKNMELARTVYYRGKEFENWTKQHPNTPVSQFESSPQYQEARIKAAFDVAKKFEDVPEAKYTLKDTNGKPYVIVNGKPYYVK